MKKFYTLITILFSIVYLHAQNVNLEVRITRLERSAYADCAGCGDPDPTWIVRGTHNGSGAFPITNCWHFGDMVNTVYDITDYPIVNINNSNATSFTLGFQDAFEKSCSNNNCTYESYNFFTCFPSVFGDSRRCQNTNLVNVNFRNQAPCVWHTAWSANCGDYRLEYSYRWTFAYAPTITSQPTPVSTLCLGNPLTLNVNTALDANGWNTGVNFQWQISNSTACPGTGWTDIAGATSNNYTVSQTPGTRLYRCKVTSNCNTDFTTNTTISNCALVTYNPIGSPGDLVPDIVSGICGSTVLPGSTHLLTVVSPPNPGAVLGVTGYTWSASGGSPTTGSSPNFTWTAPVNPGSYTINLTYNDACPQPDAQTNACVVTVGSATCDFAYVAPYGEDSIYRGGPDNPYKTLEYTLTQLNGRKYIRMATGVYNEANPLNLENDLVIEGGYKVTNNIWTKQNADSTSIICNGTQVINNDVAHRVGFVSDNDDNWMLQDLVIITNDINTKTTSNRGYSNYGVLALNGSSGFEIVRTKIYTGDAADGVSGTTPAGSGGGGGGGNGGAGGNGSNTRCNGSGGAGFGGGTGNGGASAGNGGNGCSGGGCNFLGCNANGCSGQAGINGSNGANGTGFAAGVRPATPGVSSPYYVPAGLAGNGSNGFGGGGGGGGGGGDIGSCCTCGCGSGTPNGGTGGGGGGGGLGGPGGYGAGGSFAVYASGAGTSGTIITSLALHGSAGLGGNGATGQPGSNGLNGAAGFNHGGCDGGIGGNGGRGGDGGDGGRGQDGANGLELNIATAGGAVITGSSTSVPNPYVLGINYENSKACINSEISMTKSAGVWSFPSQLSVVNDLRDNPAGSPISSYSAASSPVLVYSTTPSLDLDITLNGIAYSKYLKIADDNRALPVLSATANIICIDGSTTLSATHWGTETEFDWRIYQGTNANNPLFQSTLASPNINFFGFSPGLYVVRYRVREACCGWSKPVFDTIRISPLPIQFIVGGGGNYCPGSQGSVVTLNGSEIGVTYYLQLNGVSVDSLVGTGGFLSFAPQTTVGNYTVIAVRFALCEVQMFGSAAVNVYPEPLKFNVTGTDTICAAGQVTSTSITLSGSEFNVNYQLFKNGNIPVGVALPGSTLPIIFNNISEPGTYTVVATNSITGCKATMNDSAVILLAPQPQKFNVIGGGDFCDGDSGVVVSVTGSELNTIYVLLQGGVLPAVPNENGTGNAISFTKVAAPGFYKVRAISPFGCESFMNDSVWVTKLLNPAISSVVVSDALCNGASNGSISINATTLNGNIQYSIDSAVTYTTSGSFNSLAADNYYIVVKDDSGCISRYNANPVIVDEPIALNILLQGESPKCNGELTGSATAIVSGGSIPYTYVWNTSPVQNNFAINNLAGNQTYVITVTDDNNCSASASVSLTEPTAIVVTLQPTNVRCFQGNDGQVAISVSGGVSPYEYYLNGAFQTDSIYTGLTQGIYTVIAQDANDCSESVTFTITQPQGFVVNAGPDLISVRGQTVALNGNATSSNGIIGYWWSPDFNLSCLACQNTNATPDTTTTYVLMAMDGDSCVGYDSMTVVVKNSVQYFIPTAFSPNADQLNDFFEFDILGANTTQVSIFNRWGERIYFNPAQTNGNQNGNAFDGTSGGKKLPADTYVYKLLVTFFDSSQEEISGTITIVR